MILLQTFPPMLVGLLLFIFVLFAIILLVLYISYEAGKNITELGVATVTGSDDNESFKGLSVIEAINALLRVNKKFQSSISFYIRSYKDPFIEDLLKIFPNTEIIPIRSVVNFSPTSANTIPEKSDRVVLYKIPFKGEFVVLQTSEYNSFVHGKYQDIISSGILFYRKQSKFKADQLVRIFNAHSILPEKIVSSVLKYPLHVIGKVGSEYVVKTVETNSVIASKEELKLMYEDVEIDYSGKRYRIGLDKLIDPLVEAIKQKQNIYIMGSTGTGKTVLGGFLCSALLAAKAGKVFYMNSASIENALSPEFMAKAGDIFNSSSTTVGESLKHYTEQVSNPTILTVNQQESEKIANSPVNIILIDEAQLALKEGTQSSTVMLSMLDGDYKRMYNTVYVCLFNEQEHNVNPQAFRAGRAGLIIHLKPLKKPTADKAVVSIKKKLDSRTSIFDDVKFIKILGEENTLPQSTEPYAAAGEITLADVHGCVTPKSIVNALDEIVLVSTPVTNVNKAPIRIDPTVVPQTKPKGRKVFPAKKP